MMKAKRILSMLLIFVLTMGLLPSLLPMKADAASQYITNTQVSDITSSSFTVSFYYGKDASSDDTQTLSVTLYDSDMKEVKFNFLRIVGYTGANVNLQGNYTHTFTGISPNMDYYVRIHGNAINYSIFGDTVRNYYSDYIPVTTIIPQAPQFDLIVSDLRQTSFKVKGKIISTGTGHSVDSAGNVNFMGDTVFTKYSITVKDIYGNIHFNTGELTYSPGYTVFEYPEHFVYGQDSKCYVTLTLTNKHNMTGSIEKTVNTLKKPTATFLSGEINLPKDPKFYDIYFSCEIDADPNDEIYNVTATRPGSGEVIMGRVVTPYNTEDKTVLFHFNGLNPSTSYQFTINALCRSGSHHNIGSKTYTTGPAPVTASVTTNPPENIKTTTAKLSGEITANGNCTIGEHGFVYALNSTGHTSDTLLIGGSGVTQIKVPLSTQQLPINFTAFLNELMPVVGYDFRAYARNAAGYKYADMHTFSTWPTPAVSTGISSSIGTNSVTLSGNVISTGGRSPALRGFVLTRSSSDDPVLGGENVVLGISNIFDSSTGSYSVDFSDLIADTTYYYRPYLIVGASTYYGSTSNFSTEPYPKVPTVKLAISSMQTMFYEKNVGAVYTIPDGYGSVTKTGFVYSRTVNPLIGIDDVTNIELTDAANIDGDFSATLADLLPDTTYYYKGYATNGTSIGYSTQGRFTTPAQMTAISESLAVVTGTEVISAAATTAKVKTTVDLSSGTFLLFERRILYSHANKDPMKGNSDVINVPAGGVNGITGSGEYTTDLTELNPNTTYYLRCYTKNAQGEYYGSVITFTTDEAGMPIISNTAPAVENITVDSASLHAEIDPNGSEVTKYGVLYSTIEEEPTIDGLSSMGFVSSSFIQKTNKSYDLIEIESGVKYYCRFFAENSIGISYGDVIEFSTLEPVLPNISTSDVIVSTNTADISMSVIKDGQGFEKLRTVGIVIDTTPNPKIGDIDAVSLDTMNTALGAKTFTVYGLNYSTDYYARAYGITLEGRIYYGSDEFFTTPAQPQATVTAGSFVNLSSDSVKVYANVLSDGGSPITEMGIVYGTVPVPTIETAAKLTHVTTELGEYDITLTELMEGTTYFIRAYAATAIGTAYSEELILTITPVDYIVTYNGNGATGGSMVPQTFTAGISQSLSENNFSRTGYSFMGWAASSAGAVLYNNAQTVTISSNITLYAVWRSSGSGSGSSSDGGSIVGTTTPSMTDNQIYNGTITVRPITIGDNVSGVVTINDVITAISQAAESGSGNITFAMETISDVTTAALTIPADAFSAVVGSAASITIDTPIAKIEFDEKALTAMADATSTTNLTFTAAVVEPDELDLSAAIKEKIKDRPVYEFTVTSGNNAISDFDGGRMTVTVPYTLKPDENPSAIVVYYLDYKGNLKTVHGVYDSNNGTVKMVLSHLSKYVVGYNKTIFTDIGNTSWYANAVDFVAARNLFGGVGNYRFAPSVTMTRAMFAKVLANLEGEDLSGYTASQFIDVSPHVWYASAIAWAAENSIIGGYGNGKFGPEDEITREQMAVMLYRYIQYKGIALEIVNSTPFADESMVSSWAKEAVGEIRSYGIIGGVGNNRYAPHENAERSQVAQIFMNFLKAYVK